MFLIQNVVIFRYIMDEYVHVVIHDVFFLPKVMISQLTGVQLLR